MHTQEPALRKPCLAYSEDRRQTAYATFFTHSDQPVGIRTDRSNRGLPAPGFLAALKEETK